VFTSLEEASAYEALRAYALALLDQRLRMDALRSLGFSSHTLIFLCLPPSLLLAAGMPLRELCAGVRLERREALLELLECGVSWDALAAAGVPPQLLAGGASASAASASAAPSGALQPGGALGP
jgi:hypothetical protein